MHQRWHQLLLLPSYSAGQSHCWLLGCMQIKWSAAHEAIHNLVIYMCVLGGWGRCSISGRFCCFTKTPAYLFCTWTESLICQTWWILLLAQSYFQQLFPFGLASCRCSRRKSKFLPTGLFYVGYLRAVLVFCPYSYQGTINAFFSPKVNLFNLLNWMLKCNFSKHGCFWHLSLEASSCLWVPGDVSAEPHPDSPEQNVLPRDRTIDVNIHVPTSSAQREAALQMYCLSCS